MIPSYEWPEHYLLLTVRNRVQSTGFLLNGVTQEDFFEHWCSMWESERERRIVEISVVPISGPVFDLLESSYESSNVLEG